MEELKQRVLTCYTLKEKQSISLKRDILSLQIQDKSNDGINIIYENQEKCGQTICTVFSNKSIINCLVYGMTQTGKTGCMTAVIHHFCLSNLIPINNIYIITGLSDKDWKIDTKNRMPDSINSRVYHRANLKKIFLDEIKNQKNVLIIMDEIQIACKKTQTLNKIFQDGQMYDLDYLLEHDIKIIQFSATPDGNLGDIDDWGNHSAKVKLDPGDGYYGPKESLEQNRVRQFKNLLIETNVQDLKLEIDSLYVTPRYHIIRVPAKRAYKDGFTNQDIVMNNFTMVFDKNYTFNKVYLDSKKIDINKLLAIRPANHTFIFCCEKLRCAKTVYKEFIGVTYERYLVSPCDSTMIQGLFGRNTGYDDNGDSICYTHIESIEKYVKLWENNMKFPHGIVWKTNTTQFDKASNVTTSKGTFNSVDHIDQLRSNSSEKSTHNAEPVIVKFYGKEGQQEMKEYFNKHLKPTMPNKNGPKLKQLIDGFYKGSIRFGVETLSTEKVYNERKWGLAGGDSIMRSYPCYTDVTNPDTLQWWLIYYAP